MTTCCLSLSSSSTAKWMYFFTTTGSSHTSVFTFYAFKSHFSVKRLCMQVNFICLCKLVSLICDLTIHISAVFLNHYLGRPPSCAKCPAVWIGRGACQSAEGSWSSLWLHPPTYAPYWKLHQENRESRMTDLTTDKHNRKYKPAKKSNLY